MAKALFLMYEGFAEFEVNILSFFLKSKGFEIVTATDTLESDSVYGESDFIFRPHTTISKIQDISDYDIFVIPGGNIFPLLKSQNLVKLLHQFKQQNKWIAAICSGTALLHESGVLKEVKYSTSLTSEEEELKHLHQWEYKQKSDITVDNKIITSTGSAYVEFGVRVIRELDLFDVGEEQETLHYYKNQT
jgi:putative intracellular protease/amidase